MGQIMTAARIWLQGKKSILGGCILIAAGVAGAFFGKLSPVDGLTVAGLGFSVCGLSAKAERHQSEILTALQSVATAGVDLRLGNKAGAVAALQPVVTEAVLESIPEAAPALSVHVSGSDAAAVLNAVSALQANPVVEAKA